MFWLMEINTSDAMIACRRQAWREIDAALAVNKVRAMAALPTMKTNDIEMCAGAEV